MHRYLLRFYKKGNMRFISHLDLSRLFKRAIRKADVRVGFSNGFNPHELINIVQPLSLGYEGLNEYFEIDTTEKYSAEKLMEGLNSALPEGIKFTACKEIPVTSINMSGRCEYALYTAVLPYSDKLDMDTVHEFLTADKVFILKKDKKTKKIVEKEVKRYIISFSVPESSVDCIRYEMLLRCASNETLNPGKLLESLIRYTGADIKTEEIKIIRNDLIVRNSKGVLVSLYEI